MKRFHILAAAVLAATLLSAAETEAEFYKYRDKDGKLHFVDDESKIPPRYRDVKETYREKYDDLEQDERLEMLERDRRAIEALRERETREQQQWIRELEERQARRRIREEKEAQARKAALEERRLTTEVLISGNSVIVPVTLAYGTKETETALVLDTGAEVLTLHQNVAEALGIDVGGEERVQIVVAGGESLWARLVKLAYVKVGPVEQRDVYAIIIPYHGPDMNVDGLLGMNFLRNHRYEVDFEKQTIHWQP
jgi:clan AA aspartic protease (TIGR02281 family)